MPKADQKTTTSTSSSPKAPDSTPDPDPTNLSTGVLIGTAAAGLIGAMTAISSIKTSEKKKKKIVITNEESGLTGIVIAANQPAPTSISNIHVLASLAQNTENRLGDNDPGITEYDKKFFDRMAQQTENNTDSQDSTELKLIQSNQDWNPPVQPFLLSPFYNEYIHAMEAVTPNSCGVFGLEPIYTASGIASQSKMNTWLYDQRGKGLLSSNKILSWINEKTINISANNSGIGYSQTSDEQMEQFFKKYNDPIFNSDQMDPIVAGAAMEARIYEKISICEKYESCTPLIKVQIAGMAQNGLFLTEDQLIQVMKNENGVKSGFEELIINTPFKKDLRLGTENRLKNISYAIKLLPTIAVEQVSKLQFDTQFIPIYYINKMLTLSKFGYSLPEGVTREDLKRLKEEIKSYPNQRVTVWDIIKFNKQKYFDNEKKGKVNKSLKRSTDLSFTRHNSTTKTSRVGKNRNNINKVSVSSNGRKSIPATKISKARRNIRKNTPIYKNSYNKPTKVSKLGKSVQKTPSSSPVKKTILKKSSFTRKPTIRNSDVRKLTPKRTSTRTSTIKSIGKKVLTGIKNTTSRIRNIFRR